MENENTEKCAVSVTKDDCQSPLRLAELLQLHEDWRRGVGKYKWTDDPAKYELPPLTPIQLTMVIDGTIRMLKSFGRMCDAGK